MKCTHMPYYFQSESVRKTARKNTRQSGIYTDVRSVLLFRQSEISLHEKRFQRALDEQDRFKTLLLIF